MLYSQTLPKNTHKSFQTGGRAPGVPILDPPLLINFFISVLILFFFIIIIPVK